MAEPKRTKALIVLLVIAGIITVAVWVYAGFFKTETHTGHIETTGIVEAREVEISSKISGRVEWLCCNEGAAIKSGDLLARMDDRELAARAGIEKAAVESAKEALAEAGVSIDNAKAIHEAAAFEVKALEAESEQVNALRGDAREDFKRAQGLFKVGYLPKKELDAAKASYNSLNAQHSATVAKTRRAKANLTNTEVNIRAAGARVSTLKAKLSEAEARLNVAVVQLEDAEIRAPINGVVVYKSFEAGETVSAGASIYTVHDTSDLRARVGIGETEIHRIKLGDRAEVYPAGAGGRLFEAKVSEINEAGGFATQRDVTRGRPDIKTFKVEAAILKPDGILKPGMTVNVRFIPSNAPK